MCSSYLPMEHYFHNWTYQVQALHLCVVSALYLIVIHRYVVVTVVSWLADMHAHTRSKVDRYTITSLWLDHWWTIDRPLTDTFCNERDLCMYITAACISLLGTIDGQKQWTTSALLGHRKAWVKRLFQIKWSQTKRFLVSVSPLRWLKV